MDDEDWYVINKNDVDLYKYHQNDQELGFYKFYYQVLHHWIFDFILDALLLVGLSPVTRVQAVIYFPMTSKKINIVELTIDNYTPNTALIVFLSTCFLSSKWHLKDR